MVNRSKFPIVTVANALTGLACAVDLGFWRAIVVHPLFHRLPRSIQAAIVAHEEGHLVLGHVRQRFWWALSGLWWRNPKALKLLLHEQEYEADAYCASHGLGGYLIEFLFTSHDQANKVRPSARARIERLEHHEFKRCFSPRR